MTVEDPPLIATANQLCIVFRRNATLDTAEKRMLFAVIDLAVRDLKGASPSEQSGARRFFRSKDFDSYAEVLDLNAEWVRSELKKHAGLR